MLKSISILSLLLSSATLAHAEAAPDVAPESPVPSDAEGDAIIITATRLPVTADEIPASLTVIEKDAIDASQAIVVSDLLVRTPGVTFTRTGGYGTSTGVRIRGADSDQTVVVIDGVKLNDPSSTGGGYNFANLNVGDTARIEILRGPQSILWGSQAIGGVVNIVTALPDAPLTATFDIEAGSRETISARAGIGGKTGPVTWRVAGFTFATDGISALSPRRGATERDGFRTSGGNARVNIDLGGGALIDLRGLYSKGKVEIDSTTADTPAANHSEEAFGYAGIVVPLFDGRLVNRFAVSATQTDRDGFDPRRARPRNLDSTGWAKRYEYQGTVLIAEGWQATFGVERENTRFRNYMSIPANPATPIAAPVKASARLDSIYAQLSARILPPLTVNAGIRHDDHDRFGGNTVLGAGGVLALFDDATLVRASYGEGFKAPTLYQLGSIYGNAALRPENSKGWEAGVEQRLFGRKLSLSATYFERSADDLIVYYSCSGTPTGLCLVPGSTTEGRQGYYDNVTRTQTRGVELGAALRLGGLSLGANYSWIDAENRSPGGTFGKKLRRLPSKTGNAEASYAFDFGLTLGGAVRWSADAFENDTNTVKLGDYTLVDLRASMRITDNLELYGRVENLFDKYYETALNYNSLGRSIHAGLRGRF